MRLRKRVHVVRTREEAAALPPGAWGLGPKHASMLRAKQRYRGLVGGIGSGKTMLGVILAMQLLGQRRCTGQVVASTYRNLKDFTIPAWRALVPRELYQFKATDMEFHLANGSVLRMRSADDPDRLRGPSLSFFWGDEAAMWPVAVWNIMIGRLREHGRAGIGYITTSPRGRNWVWEKFGPKVGESPEECARREAKYHYVQVGTADNPFLSRELYEDLREQYGIGWFGRQELDGEFCDPEGGLFRREWLRVEDAVPSHFQTVARGWDLAVTAKTHADYTAGVKIGITADETIWVLDVVRGQWEWPEGREILLSTAHMDGRECLVYVEDVGTQAGFVQELMVDEALRGYFVDPVHRSRATGDKLTMALPLASRAKAGKVRLAPGAWNADFIEELCAFDGQGKVHDDQTDAWVNAYANLAAPAPTYHHLGMGGQEAA